MLIDNGKLFDSLLGLEIGSVAYRYNKSAQYFGNATRIIGEADDDVSTSGGFNTIAGTRRGSRTRPGSDSMQKNDYVNTSVNLSLQKLPVESIISYADSLTAADVVDFGAGDTVQLVFDIQDQQGLEKSLRDKVAGIMSQNDVRIAGQSDFTLEFVYNVGQPETKTYRIIGGPTVETRTVTVTPKTCRATLKYQGQKIWSQGASGGLGNPFSEEQLNGNIENAKNVSADQLLKYQYPNSLRLVDPRKQREFSWE